ncbi:MAG: ACP S-malonyltransferase [Okeania sp. SIO3B5]|uniref:DUF5615 family PIN-like protein n=1 Tax=Okeania sp. SIO3B5 TaxID=2607811 RepID=UPI0014013810|nr:DUF5615 family PIN-like protein [Okeania sp. SIO3B5]NEO55076.1 ACP S-malonyltransferase [Okeania sp. SIO3B5]
MNFLIDYNLNGPALILLGSLTASGWLDLIDIRFVSFSEVELPMNSSDREVWRFAQANQMILLTANRNMKGKDSLEQVIREENTPTSLPVLTVANVERLLADSNYRERCLNRLVEIAIDIEYYQGTMRIFIP